MISYIKKNYGKIIIFSALIFLIIGEAVFAYNFLKTKKDSQCPNADQKFVLSRLKENSLKKDDSTGRNWGFDFEFVLQDYRCQLKKQPDENVRNEALGFINEVLLNNSEDSKVRKINFVSDNSFLLDIINKDMREICPDKLVDLCRVKSLSESPGSREDGVCPKLCKVLADKTDDPQQFQKEMFEFDGWDGPLSNLLITKFAWRMAIIQRFYGSQGNWNFCGKLSGESRESCLRTADFYKIDAISCDNIGLEEKKYYCDKNYFSKI